MPSYFKTIKNKIYNEWIIKALIKNSLMPKPKRAYMSASSTVEASLVMPIFIYAVMAIMYIMQFILFYINVEIAMYNTAKEMSIAAYELSVNHNDKDSIYNSKILGKTAISSLIISDLNSNNVFKNNIVGGVLGIDVSNSIISEDELTINIKYRLKNPLDIFKLSTISVTQKASTRPWIGVDAEESDDKNIEYVYITENGSVYHKTKECTYLTIDIKAADISDISHIRNAGGGIYYACEQCANSSIADVTQVYISKYGDRYHVDRKCTRIRREILTIHINDIGNRRKCSKCY